MNKNNDFFSKIRLFLSETDQLKRYLPQINSAGYPFIALFFFVSLLLSLFSDFLGWIGFILSLWCVYFFRDPSRVTPDLENIVVAPADGKIIKIDLSKNPEVLSEKKTSEMQKISIFMNVFNVHVNRTPISGEIQKIVYKAGSFLNASLDKASEKNERSSMVIANDNNIKIIVVQIAGLIARRILGFVSEKQFLEQGERYGLIRFGSRVDIYMPLDATVTCAEGDKVVAGKSKLAKLNNTHE